LSGACLDVKFLSFVFWARFYLSVKGCCELIEAQILIRFSTSFFDYKPEKSIIKLYFSESVE
jgi:hypothetical protein